MGAEFFVDKSWDLCYNEITIDGKLIRQTGGVAGKIDFIYGASGMIGFEKNGTRYFYRRNLMGDVTHIYNEVGTFIAKYVYDAWGNCKVVDLNNKEIDDLTNMGHLNPIRYRGYYYDTETELYYLRSRYYDPETGRFISQDDVNYLAPTHLSGLNLHAYCNDNPVSNIDPNGHSVLGFLALVLLSGVIIHAATLVTSYAIAAVASIWDPVIRKDMNNIHWNPFNTSEEATLKMEKVSFYKGSAVWGFKTKKFSSFAFGGMIFFKESDRKRSDAVTTLNHEWGHNMQELIFGEALYITNVAIPSAIYCAYDAYVGGAPYDYYSMPWERVADWLGGVNRSCGYKDKSLAWGIVENILGPIVIPFYFLLGY